MSKSRNIALMLAGDIEVNPGPRAACAECSTGKLIYNQFLLLSGDVETNPGPDTQTDNHNVTANDKSIKVKTGLNFLYINCSQPQNC